MPCAPIARLAPFQCHLRAHEARRPLPPCGREAFFAHTSAVNRGAAWVPSPARSRVPSPPGSDRAGAGGGRNRQAVLRSSPVHLRHARLGRRVRHRPDLLPVQPALHTREAVARQHSPVGTPSSLRVRNNEIHWGLFLLCSVLTRSQQRASSRERRKSPARWRGKQASRLALRDAGECSQMTSERGNITTFV